MPNIENINNIEDTKDIEEIIDPLHICIGLILSLDIRHYARLVEYLHIQEQEIILRYVIKHKDFFIAYLQSRENMLKRD